VALQPRGRAAKIAFVMGAENTGWLPLDAASAPSLQAFFEANPEYWRVVMESAVPADAARQVFDDRPPAEWRWDRMWIMGAHQDFGALVAMASIIEGLFDPSIWHVGLFIVAGRLHGTGASGALYASLEEWMRGRGAQWIRLGVVVGNTPAERFWEKAGFIEVRRRYGIEVEGLVRDLRVMVKPLAGGKPGDYLRMVERDRPE